MIGVLWWSLFNLSGGGGGGAQNCHTRNELLNERINLKNTNIDNVGSSTNLLFVILHADKVIK